MDQQIAENKYVCEVRNYIKVLLEHGVSYDKVWEKLDNLASNEFAELKRIGGYAEKEEKIIADDRMKKAILESTKVDTHQDLEQTIRFFTHCCKHCQMMDLSCSASMMCQCHDEQIDEIKALIPEWRREMKK